MNTKMILYISDPFTDTKPKALSKVPPVIVDKNAIAPPGKKVVKRIITVTEKVLRKTVKAKQILPVDLTLEKNADDREEYEKSFKKNAGAGDGTTVSYVSIPASDGRRRLDDEGSSRANWILAFADGTDVDKAKDLVSSEKFSNIIAADTGLAVEQAAAEVATVMVEIQVEKEAFVLVDDNSRAATKPWCPNSPKLLCEMFCLTVMPTCKEGW